MNSIPLDNAYLCLDCQHISECASICPRCSSVTLFPVASWLNRGEPKDDVVLRRNQVLNAARALARSQ